MPKIHEKFIFPFENFQLANHFDAPNLRIVLHTLNTQEELREFLRTANDVVDRSLYCFLLVVKCKDEVIASKVKSDFCVNNVVKKEFFIEVLLSSRTYARFMYNGTGAGVCLSLSDNADSIEFAQNPILDRDVTSEDCKVLLEKEVTASKPLLIRLIKCFDVWDDVNLNKRLMKHLVCGSCVSSIRAFLDLPIVYQNDQLSILSNESVKLLKFRYGKRSTLLMIACEANNRQMVELLCKFVDINESDSNSHTASDYAKSLEILILLLENDARFPEAICQKLSDGSKLDAPIIRIVSERSELHEAIVNGNSEVIRSFRAKHPKLVFAYNCTKERSQSALFTALTESSDDFRTINLLLANGFNWDKKDEMGTEISLGVLNRLHEEQPSHINYLLSKCKIIPGKGQSMLECWNKLKEIFETISQSKVVAILQLIEYTDSLTIVVDFYNEYVTHTPNADECFRGYTDHHSGHIYVNASADGTLSDVLVHECCHLALYDLFNNGCNPYFHFDEQLKGEFKDIVDGVQKELKNDRRVRLQEDKIILQTYDYYRNECDRPKELIARVPQLIVMGRTEYLEKNFPKLLRFFEENVLFLMQSVVQKPEHFLIKRNVEKLNDFLRHLQEIGRRRKEDGIYTNVNRFAEKAERTKLIECQCPRLYMADIYKTIIESMKRNEIPTKLYIVTCVEDFESKEYHRLILRIWKRSQDITLVINCDSYNKNHLKNLKFLTDAKGKFVVVGVDDTVKGEIGYTRYCEIVTYTRKDIDADSLNLLLETLDRVSFQGHSLTVKQLIGDSTDAIPLEKLVNGKKIVIKRVQPLIDHYRKEEYVERKFVGYENVDCVLSLLMTKKNLLLIDTTGSGKSIVLARCEEMLKEKHPDYWVIRKGLRELSRHISEDMTVKAFLKLCVDQTDKDFQEKLMIEFCKKEKIILLLDAADEIVETPENFWKLLEELNGSVPLFVTSQQHLEDNLIECLPGAERLKLKPFSKDDQVTCVSLAWHSIAKSSSNIPMEEGELEKLAEKMVNSFVDSVDISDENIGEPLITRMLAEICADDGFTFKYHYTGIYTLFVDFVQRKIRRAMREKGEETVDEFGDNMTKDIYYIYGRLALNYLFRFKNEYRFVYTDDAFQKELLLIDADYLKRSGLISWTSDNKYIFDDDIFAEFLAAMFVVKSFRTKEDLEVAVDVLWTVSRPTLIKFIDGGFRKFYDVIVTRKTLAHDIMKKMVHDYLEKKGKNKRFLSLFLTANMSQGVRGSTEDDDDDDDDDVGLYRFKYFYGMYNYIKYDAYFSVNFLVKCLPLQVRKSVLADGFYQLFDQPQRFFSLFLIATLWTNHEAIARKILTNTIKGNDEKRNIFQHIFLRFPTDILDVITDNKNIDQLKVDMYVPKSSPTLPSIEERFARSTLKLLIDKAKQYLNEEERENLWKSRDEVASYWKSKIGDEYFEDALDIKLMAMKDLGYPFTSWHDLMTNTVFEGVIHRIFTSLDENKFIIRFYRWANERQQAYATMEGFQYAVRNTFSRYFWRCSKDYDATEFLQFVRATIQTDVTTLLDTHVNEIVPIFTRSSWAFPLAHKYFTSAEFAQLVTRNDSNGVNVVSEYVASDNTSGILELSQLLHEPELVQRLTVPLNESKASTLRKWIYSTAIDSYREDATKYWCVERMFEVIETLLTPENIKNALQFQNDEGTVFHAAAKHRDLFMLKLVWQMARNYITDDAELESLLTRTNGNNVSIILIFDPRHLTVPPSVNNTFGRACFEFIPFDWTDIPNNAVTWYHDESCKTFCIGRRRNILTNSDELYEIVYNEFHKHFELPALIERDGREGETLNEKNGMKILSGKGFQWMEATIELNIDARDYCFMYNNNSDYFSFVNGRITLVRDFSVGQLILEFSDHVPRNEAVCLYRLQPNTPTPSHHSIGSDISSVGRISNGRITPASIPPVETSDDSLDLDASECDWDSE